MPALTKISDLLPFPEGTKKPHAYQVFGLEGGEQDAEKIKAAVAQVYERLRDTKADADPKLWRRAAKAVEKARSILSNPQKRAALDARFGVINFDDVHNANTGPDPLAAVLPSSDPLKSVLPSSDPLASVVPGGNPMAVATPPPPAPGMAPTAPMQTAHAGTTTATAPTPNATPVTAGDPRNFPGGTSPASQPMVFKAKRSLRYRRKSSLGTMMFTGFVVATLAIIGGLGYMLFQDQQILITTGEQQEQVPVQQVGIGQKANTKPVNKDPVLGDVPSGPKQPIGSLNGNEPIDAPPAMQPDNPAPQPPPDPVPVTPTPPENPTPDPEPAPSPDKPDTPDTPANPDDPTMLPVKPAGPDGPPVEMTDEMIKAGNDAIAKVEMLIKQAKWDEMKSAANTLTEMTLTEEQQVHADALYNLADLATFYRGGVIKGIGTLNTASTFEITEGVPVLVVETTANGLTIRANARNRDYTIDTMPFALADRLAAFAMSQDDPDTVAARSCFHAISPKANEEYRKDAVNWLEFVSSDLEGVDAAEIVKVIKKLFPDAR